MADVREMLISLLCRFSIKQEWILAVGNLASYLIENGVTIPVRCKDCRNVRVWKSGYWCDCNEHYVEENDFCSAGVRRNENE